MSYIYFNKNKIYFDYSIKMIFKKNLIKNTSIYKLFKI